MEGGGGLTYRTLRGNSRDEVSAKGITSGSNANAQAAVFRKTYVAMSLLSDQSNPLITSSPSSGDFRFVTTMMQDVEMSVHWRPIPCRCSQIRNQVESRS
jgi:hypothetical protein